MMIMHCWVSTEKAKLYTKIRILMGKKVDGHLTELKEVPPQPGAHYTIATDGSNHLRSEITSNLTCIAERKAQKLMNLVLQ